MFKDSHTCNHLFGAAALSETNRQLDSNITLYIKRGVFDDEKDDTDQDIMRRTMPPINAAREKCKSWFLPKLPPNIQKDFISQDSDPNLPLTFPPPVTPRRGPLKPSQGRTRTTTVSTTTENTVPKIDFKDIFHSDPYVREFNIPRTEETTPQIIDNYDMDIGGYPVKRKRNNQPVKRSLSNIVVLHDPKIYKTSKQMSQMNHTENIYNKVITVFEYVTKTIRAEALLVNQ
ncbi:uncharacterized protein LOC113235930 [Hyposmocoma kahamanoa]|uniref:uncharacterized protein LOC113235930 n=1 Tax=Hyposmocoma kahamanoa TaxID=1477025 RepID=UPI000E6D6533|nr:uncharacterized protein LOC113235930 [Hyposmocoma kahamanoa]